MKNYLIILFLSASLTSFGQSQIISALSFKPEYVPYNCYIDSSFAKCDSTWNTNSEWGECIGEHISLWENLMNQFYDSLLKELDTTGQSLLKLSQKDWNNQKKTQHGFWNYFEDIAAGYFGREGHFEAMYYELNTTRDRAIELQAYLELIRDKKEEEKENDDKK